MMDQKDIECLTRQLKAVLLNKPINENMKTQTEELQDLQEGMEYLAESLRETNTFLRNLCEGRLNTEPPGRHNYMAGNLKELHSILKHMTWQTTQVANGDYSQKVRFLGEFSDSFNRMIQQLKEREINISAKSASFAKTMNLLKSVLDGQKDWVVVLDTEKRDVIYANLSAQHKFYDMNTGFAVCREYDELLEYLKNKQCLEEDEVEEYICAQKGKMLLIRSSSIDWNECQACVYCISDITDQREERDQLQHMAYTDEMTGAQNRRYCLEKIETLLETGDEFSVVLIDLDGLKNVNDTFGHRFGDDYIVGVSRTIMGCSRTADRLCRIGGDEFVLILPECNDKNAEQKMKRICAQLSALDKEFPVSISFGIVAVDGSWDLTGEELLSMADMKMYRMKNQHKNEGLILMNNK